MAEKSIYLENIMNNRVNVNPGNTLFLGYPGRYLSG
jgi:hypothetical protein